MPEEGPAAQGPREIHRDLTDAELEELELRDHDRES